MLKGISLMGTGDQAPWPGAGLCAGPSRSPLAPGPGRLVTCSLCTGAQVLSLRTAAVGVGVPRPSATQAPSAREDQPCVWEYGRFPAEGASSTDLCSPDPVSGVSTRT